MTTLKPATPKARALLAKLTALAEQGINGEKVSAQKKLDRLMAKYDFTAPDTSTEDLFAGCFQPASDALRVATIPEMDIANAVKWSFEETTGIRCLFRGAELFAQANNSTALRMEKIAGTVAESFRELWTRYAQAGANPADRGNFMLGLYEGMMHDERHGERLPTRISHVSKVKAKRKAVALAPGLNLHPYSVAVNLGKQIRFAIPIQDIAAQLDRTIKGEIAA